MGPGGEGGGGWQGAAVNGEVWRGPQTIEARSKGRTTLPARPGPVSMTLFRDTDFDEEAIISYLTPVLSCRPPPRNSLIDYVTKFRGCLCNYVDDLAKKTNDRSVTRVVSFGRVRVTYLKLTLNRLNLNVDQPNKQE